MLKLDKPVNKPDFTRYTSQARIISLKGDDDNEPPLPDESHLSEEDAQILLPATPKVTPPKEQDGNLNQRVKSI